MDKLIIVAGPTAVGKSDFAVKLAKRINGEIISADSIQVYKGFDIGSAKITKEEMQGVKHYLIDVLEPHCDFNVTVFQKLAKEAISEIIAKGKIPIIAGGTGFYIQSVLYDIDFTESKGEISKYRLELENIYKEKGQDYLFELLKECDPESANLIHKNNVKRVIRALEFYKETGKKISDHNSEQRSNSSKYNYCYFVLNDDRACVYQRIDNRVDKMISDGLVDEVKALVNLGLSEKNLSMQGIGYKEILQYLNNEITLEEASNNIKLNSRHFAKRQLTWFNREKDIVWLNRPDFSNNTDAILDFALHVLKDKKIL